MEDIAFDAHKRYTQVSVETVDGERRHEGRITHARGALQQFLTTCERGSPVTTEGAHPLRPAPGEHHPRAQVAFIEAANPSCLQPQARPHRHVSRRSASIQLRKGHPTAVGAVVRHVAEATSWILTKREPHPRTRGTPGVLHGGTSAGSATSARCSALDCDVPPGHHHAALTAKIWIR